MSVDDDLIIAELKQLVSEAFDGMKAQRLLSQRIQDNAAVVLAQNEELAEALKDLDAHAICQRLKLIEDRLNQ